MVKTTEDKKESPTKIRREFSGYNEMILKDLGKYTQTSHSDKDFLNKDVTLHFSGSNYLWFSHNCYKAEKGMQGKSELRLIASGIVESLVGEIGKLWLTFKCNWCSFKAKLQIRRFMVKIKE